MSTKPDVLAAIGISDYDFNFKIEFGYTTIMAEEKKSVRHVMWRINPKQCDYSKMKDTDTFSSAASITLNVGDIIYAIASGTDRYKGLLGKWRVDECYYGVPRRDQDCWVAPMDIIRKQPQWRVIATNIYDTSIDNGAQVIAIFGPDRLKIPRPSFIKDPRIIAALDLL